MTDWKIILRSKKLKATPIRIKILQALEQDHCSPIDAHGILSRLKKVKINLVTIYRTLESFLSVGLVRRIDLHQKSVHYELANHHHHHIICENCGELESFDTCELATISRKILAKSQKFKSINDHALEFFGSCHKCLKNEK